MSPSYLNFNLSQQSANLLSINSDPDRARNLSNYSGGDVSIINVPLTVQWHWFTRTFISPYFIFGPTINYISVEKFEAVNQFSNTNTVLEQGSSDFASGRVFGFGANFNLSKNVSIFAERSSTRIYSNSNLNNPGFNQTRVGFLVKFFTTKPKDCKTNKPNNTEIKSVLL
jgi:hypothetical protein